MSVFEVSDSRQERPVRDMETGNIELDRAVWGLHPSEAIVNSQINMRGN